MKKKLLIGCGGLTLATVGIGLAGLYYFVKPVMDSLAHDEMVTTMFDQWSDEEKATALAALMDGKCAMCHTSTAKPVAILDTLSGGLQSRDIIGAQRAFLLDADPSIRTKQVDLLKMDRVLTKRSMPPAQYTIMHWGDMMSDEDIKLMRSKYSEAEANKLRFAAIADKGISPEEADKVLLGHMLYVDKRLSSDNTISCASCHDLTKGGTDNAEKSEGVYKDGKPQYGGVNAPTNFNAEGHIAQFWDGRAADLKAQAGGPPLNPVEMGYAVESDWGLIAGKLKQDPAITALFDKVYGGAGITGETITDAIAAFEKTLVTPDSPFDRYLKGDKSAMTEQQVRGMESYVEFGCATCHSGPTMGGQSFEFIHTFADLRALLPQGDKDAARGRVECSKDDKHTDMFRVPTLRNVALTAPYFHTGSVTELKQAVQAMLQTQSDASYSPEQLEDITAFLNAQTGQYKGKSLDQLTPADVAPAPAPTPAP
ncbi:MAG: cytochrome c peroxidase [Akkermansia sp.]